MKSGIIRRIDDLGRIVIPRAIREQVGITEGDPIEIIVDGDKLYLEKYIASYEYEKHILGIINRIIADDDLTDEKVKAISLLKKAGLALHPTNLRSEVNLNVNSCNC